MLFPATHALPHVMNAGDVFYTVGVMMGLILWGFAIVWFVVAVMMISLSGRFPFNMGWWGFIFPIGEYYILSSTLDIKKTTGASFMVGADGGFCNRRLQSPHDRSWRRVGV